MARATLGIATILAGASADATPPGPADAAFAAIRRNDVALERIGYRLATANAALCDRLQPGTGLVLHTPEQYPPALRAGATRYFGFDGPIGVEGVIAGSPAALAGIRPDDTVFAVGAAQFPPVEPGVAATTAPLVAAAAQIAALPPAGPVTVRGRRAGVDYALTLRPVPACRSRFELDTDGDFSARADGEMVQVGDRFLNAYPDDQVAAVVAHELAHNILRHRARLAAQGISFGMLSGFGRNVRYFRQSELEADILSVALLANAGYDPAAAARFWRTFGPSRAGGLLRSRSHPAWRDRLAAIEAAARALGTARPARPAILSARDRPLDGNWQALLVAK